MKLVTTGIQGCGKGTQARILVEKYGFTLIEMGGEFRKIIASGSELGLKLKSIMDTGAQVPGEL
jgi:adenylate kinase